MSIQISGACALADGSVTAEKINTGIAGDGQVLTADGAGGAAWEAPAGGSPGYLEYVAHLTQSGTNAPVAIVLKNTLGGTVVWTRDSVGLYRGTLSAVFLEGRTLVFPQSCWSAENQNIAGIVIANSSDISVATYDMSGYPVQSQVDGILDITIEIRVYP